MSVRNIVESMRKDDRAIQEVRQHIQPILRLPQQEPYTQGDYVTGKEGQIKLTDFNIRKWLIESGVIDKIYFDEFSERYMFRDGDSERPLSESDIAQVRDAACKDVFKGHKLKDADFFDGMRTICRRLNPVHELIRSLQWDGIPRAGRILIDEYGAPDDPYISEATKLFILAIISRAFHPGTKFDYMIVLQGAQGIGKSSFFKSMAIKEDWFAEIGAADMADKKLLGEKAQGKLILEYGELDGIRKAAAERLKATITSTDDNYRAAYARTAESRPRKYVLGGTTNSSTYLSDPTGNRRFLPIPITKQHFLNRATVLQLYAEMYEVYQSGDFKLYFDEDIEKTANSYRENVTMLISDDYIEDIRYHLEKEVPKQEYIQARQIHHNLSGDNGCFEYMPYNKDVQAAIRQAMDRLGWKYKSGRPKNNSDRFVKAYWRPKKN